MKTPSLFNLTFLFLILTYSTDLRGQSESIVIKANIISVDGIETAEVNIVEPSFETYRKYVVELTLLRIIEVSLLRNIELEAKTFYSDQFNTKKLVVKTLNWGEVPAQKTVPDSELVKRFYDYIYQRLESEELTGIEGIFESIDEGNDFEYLIAILKSQDEPGTYIAYTLSSTDPEIPVASSIYKLRTTAVANKYLTQYWLKNGYTTSNQLSIYNEGILNAGPKSFIKMYPGLNETRKYREINPLVDWDACGSGVLLGPGGIIATNYHVIKNAKVIRVKIAIDENIIEYPAALVAQDAESDVALLRISDTSNMFSGVSPVSLRDSIVMGEEVMTLGYPIPDKMGENVKFNKGYVSALTGNNNRKDYFQTDLPVWYGNSGGPCFDLNGNLLGLVSEIRFDKGQKLENVCFVTNSVNLLNLISATKYKQDITTTKSNQKATTNDLISRSVFIKVNF